MVGVISGFFFASKMHMRHPNQEGEKIHVTVISRHVNFRQSKKPMISHFIRSSRIRVFTPHILKTSSSVCVCVCVWVCVSSLNQRLVASIQHPTTPTKELYELVEFDRGIGRR